MFSRKGVLEGCRELFALIVKVCGLPIFLFYFYAKKRVSILVYHDPSVECFETHLKYLSSKYNFITIAQLYDAICLEGWKRLPVYPLLITFDDGHRGNYQLLDLFRKYNLHPTIYICTGIVGAGRRFWFKCSPGVRRDLKKQSNENRLHLLKESFGFTPEKDYGTRERQALSYEEMRHMSEYVDFQSHTKFHPILPKCTDDECRREIDESVAVQYFEVLPTFHHFAFPNGDYGQREIKYIKAAGFFTARTTDYGWNGPNTDPYRLKILGATDNASLNVLKVQMSGVPFFLRRGWAKLSNRFIPA